MRCNKRKVLRLAFLDPLRLVRGVSAWERREASALPDYRHPQLAVALVSLRAQYVRTYKWPSGIARLLSVNRTTVGNGQFSFYRMFLRCEWTTFCGSAMARPALAFAIMLARTTAANRLWTSSERV